MGDNTQYLVFYKEVEMAEFEKRDEKIVAANLKMLNKKVNMELEKATADEDLTADEEKFLKLRENEEFMKDILKAENSEAVRSAFQKQAVDLSEQEADEFVEGVQNTVGKVMNATGELSEDELEEIAGGSWLSSAWKKAKKYVVAAVIAGVASAVSAAIVAVTFGTATGVAAVLEAAAISGAIGMATGGGGAIAKDLWSKQIAPAVGLG
jgi:hypothetical protein